MKQILLILILSISSFSFAASKCEINPEIYQGKDIVFHKYRAIDYGLECGRGGSLIGVYCDSQSASITSKSLCRVGKVLACRFCKPQGTSVCNYNSLKAKTKDKLPDNVNLTAETCESLEATGKNIEKNILSYDQLCTYRASLIKRIQDIKSQLIIILRQNSTDLRSEKPSFSTYDWQKEVTEIIQGKDGLVETLDHLGISKTSLRLIKIVRENERAWNKVKARSLSLYNIPDDEYEEFITSVGSIITLYDILSLEFEKLAYKPAGATEARSCR